MNAKVKYIFQEIKKNWKRVDWWVGRVNYYLMRNYYYKVKGNKGIYIMNEDWDNLIILDACRYDTFIEVYKKRCDYKISRGSNTQEFIQQNFVNRKFYDTIYISASPWVDLLCRNSFYSIISVWKDHWDDRIGTVLPENVVEAALNIADEHPNKRYIIHFLQPHHPFIKNPEINIFWRYNGKALGALDPIKLKKDFNPFNEVKKGNLKLEQVYEAYKQNLEVVLPFALKLAKKLGGKTVITADHGEAFGEFAWPFPIRIYGHPAYTHIPSLVKVPWLTICKGSRRDIRVNKEIIIKHKISKKIKKIKDKL